MLGFFQRIAWREWRYEIVDSEESELSSVIQGNDFQENDIKSNVIQGDVIQNELCLQTRQSNENFCRKSKIKLEKKILNKFVFIHHIFDGPNYETIAYVIFQRMNTWHMEDFIWNIAAYYLTL